MSTALTVVNYHYVHTPERGPFGRLVGRSYEEFHGQLDHIQRNFTVVGHDRLMDALAGRRPLPANACALTFDDGYRIHHTVAFQALRARGIPGFFFPPALSALEPVVLDVHKIHFALASSTPHADMAADLRGWIDAEATARALEPAESYWKAHATPSRWDPPPTMFIKRTLQKGLPEAARSAAVDWLFRRFAGHVETELSPAFYMRPAELAEMIDAGMYVGSHGYAHRWLDTLSDTARTEELERSLAFLSGIGAPVDRWLMCYPYGGFNAPLVDALRPLGCVGGFTTKVATADLATDDPLLLPRLDTNDLPLRAAA